MKLKDASSEVRVLSTLFIIFIETDNVFLLSHNKRFLCSQICRLKSVIHQQEKKEKSGPEAASSTSHLEEELHQTRSRLARIQEEAERQRDRQQREITSLRADKHRLEEKVLEQSRLNTERNLLDQSQRHTEDQIR